MQFKSIFDSNPYAVIARHLWQEVLHVAEAAPEAHAFLKKVNVRDIELVFMLYAAVGSRDTPPWGDRFLIPTFLQLSHEFLLPVPLLDQFLTDGLFALLKQLPDQGKEHRPDLELVVRECKGRLAGRQPQRRKSEGSHKSSAAADSRTRENFAKPEQPDSLEVIRNYLTKLGIS